MMETQFLKQVLERKGLIEAHRLDEVTNAAVEKGVGLYELLIGSHIIEEKDLVQALAEEARIPFQAKIEADQIPEAFVERVPINFARQNRIVPIQEDEHTIYVATSDPFNLSPLDDLRALLGKEIQPIAVPRESIEDAINRVYERKDEASLSEGKDSDEGEELQDLIDMTDEAPVIRWVNNLFYTSVKERASDIHIEPTENEVVVRYRIDGRLIPKKTAHKGFLPSIVSRVKIEAGLNIAEKRLPQDGRITKKIAGKLIDIRVSTIPTAKGERVVMRLLDKEQVRLDLSILGFSDDQKARLDFLIHRPNGIVLVTGPTGSGKTTTLYASLSTINTPDKNILTVEDPVEYELKGIGQMQIQPKIGLTFASGLRSFLRQDPDVIMVGEIRDEETAEIAIHASLTGHLVLSTLHTNDAPSAITRLVDMGIQPFLISSSILAVLAQRLVRKLCLDCRVPYEATEQDLRSLNLDRMKLVTFLAGSDKDKVQLSENGKPLFFKSAGCETCGHTGYRGRQGIFELMVVDESVRKEIINNSDSATIMKVACGGGMRTLREDGARQVLIGRTSVEEVLAATQAGEIE